MIEGNNFTSACVVARRFSMSEIKHSAATLTTGVASLTLAMAPLLLLFWLMQPKVLVNPGIGALRVAPLSVEPPYRESPASLTQDSPQYRQPRTPAQRELRASNRRRSRMAQKRKTMASPLPALRHERQGRLATAAGGKDWLTP